MSTCVIQWSLSDAQGRSRPAAAPPRHSVELGACPVCGAMVESRRVGKRQGWACLTGGLAHYYQAEYGHLEQWFTSGEGNLREPVIQAMDRSA